MTKAQPITSTLADSIARQIAEGALKPGDKLPSLRTLAALHGYAKNTVVAAFEQLVARGLVEPRRGSGFFVKAPARAEPAPESQDEAAAGLGRAMDIVWMMREQFRTVPNTLAVGDGFPPVHWLADVRLDKFHHKVARAGLGTVFRYTTRYGYPPLRDHLVGKLADFGIAAEPQQIVLTHGANDALDLVVRYFVPPGAAVLVDDPGYYLLHGKLKLAGARIVGVPRGPDGPDIAALEQLLLTHKPRLFFTQSVAHNPTGSDTSAAKAYRVLQLAQAHNLLIVENDSLADFKPMGSTRIAALDQLERTIYIGSFSKSFSAALRVGFVACGADLASDLADLKALIHANSSEYAERTLDVLLSEGRYQRHLTRLRQRVGAAMVQARALLDDLGAEVFTHTPHSLYLWAALPGWADSQALARELLPQGLMLAPGRIFCVDSAAPSPWSRFNVGALADPQVQAVLKRALRGGRRSP
jgi:DNA-binding transcriptional MocR family regulator